MRGCDLKTVSIWSTLGAERAGGVTSGRKHLWPSPGRCLSADTWAHVSQCPRAPSAPWRSGHCILGPQLMAGDRWGRPYGRTSRMARSWGWLGFWRSGTSPTFLKIRSVKRATLFNNYIRSSFPSFITGHCAWMFWPFTSLCHGSELMKTPQNLHWPVVLADLRCCRQSARGFHECEIALVSLGLTGFAFAHAAPRWGFHSPGCILSCSVPKSQLPLLFLCPQ